MEQMTVADFKARFSEVITLVANGGSVQILYGRTHRPIAVLSAYVPQQDSKRVIGTYDGIAAFSETGGGKITEEEFLGL
jgi:antitoxin (DNA-binding transcriptional repressor) of toxin-antitoxin stability system